MCLFTLAISGHRPKLLSFGNRFQLDRNRGTISVHSPVYFKLSEPSPIIRSAAAQEFRPLHLFLNQDAGKAAAKSGKATKAIAKGDKKKRKGKRKESYAIYIYKVI